MQIFDKDIIKHLNIALCNKLAAINQYFLHARMMKHMGFVKLADYEYKESIQQMKYADKLVERVLTLGGMPNLHERGALNIGTNLEEILKYDLQLEENVKSDLETAISRCKSGGDSLSSELLQKILENKEEHISFINSQINLIDSLGLDGYLQSQV